MTRRLEHYNLDAIISDDTETLAELIDPALKAPS